MHPFYLSILTLIFTSISAYSEDLSVLDIELKKVKSTEGEIILSVYSKEEDWLKEGKEVQKVKIKANYGSVKVTFSKLERGDYAIAAIHDENSNGKLDFTWYMKPEEGVGISKDATGSFGPPSFYDAKFSLTKDSSLQVINMDYP